MRKEKLPSLEQLNDMMKIHYPIESACTVYHDGTSSVELGEHVILIEASQVLEEQRVELLSPQQRLM